MPNDIRFIVVDASPGSVGAAGASPSMQPGGGASLMAVGSSNDMATRTRAQSFGGAVQSAGSAAQAMGAGGFGGAFASLGQGLAAGGMSSAVMGAINAFQQINAEVRRAAANLSEFSPAIQTATAQNEALNIQLRAQLGQKYGAVLGESEKQSGALERQWDRLTSRFSAAMADTWLNSVKKAFGGTLDKVNNFLESKDGTQTGGGQKSIFEEIMRVARSKKLAGSDKSQFDTRSSRLTPYADYEGPRVEAENERARRSVGPSILDP